MGQVPARRPRAVRGPHPRSSAPARGRAARHPRWRRAPRGRGRTARGRGCGARWPSRRRIADPPARSAPRPVRRARPSHGTARDVLAHVDDARRPRLEREERVEGRDAVRIGRRHCQPPAELVQPSWADPADALLQRPEGGQQQMSPCPGCMTPGSGVALDPVGARASLPARGRLPEHVVERRALAHGRLREGDELQIHRGRRRIDDVLAHRPGEPSRHAGEIRKEIGKTVGKPLTDTRAASRIKEGEQHLGSPLRIRHFAALALPVASLCLLRPPAARGRTRGRDPRRIP